MPVYEYACGCGAKTEAFRRIDDRDNAPGCFACGGDTERRIVATMVSVFTPYVTAAVDKEEGKKLLIRNKADHEAFFRRNGYEEVGDDKSMAPVSREEDRERRQRWADEPAAPMVDVERLQREGFIQEDLCA